MANKLRFHKIDPLRGTSCLMVVAFPYLHRTLPPAWEKPGWIEDIERALDTLSLLARGKWARGQFGPPVDLIEKQVASMEATSKFMMERWVREAPGLPRCGVPLMGKVCWWFANRFDLGWFGVY